MKIISVSSYSGINFKVVVSIIIIIIIIIIIHWQLTALTLEVALFYVSLDDSEVILSLVLPRGIFIVVLTFKFLKR